MACANTTTAKKRWHGLIAEGGVKGPAGRLEVHILAILGRLAGTVIAVHAAVFPLDRQRSVVADVVERPDNLLEPDMGRWRG